MTSPVYTLSAGESGFLLHVFGGGIRICGEGAVVSQSVDSGDRFRVSL